MLRWQPGRQSDILPRMIAFLLTFGRLASPDSPALSDRVCEMQFRLIDAHYTELLNLRAQFGGGGLIDQELELTRRWRDLWWAAWWVNWPSATAEDLDCWGPIFRERLAEWLER